MSHMRIVDLIARGRTDYLAADARQRELHREVRNGGEDALILAEFTPTYTAGRHTAPQDVRDARLPILHVDRAGSVTWHGPGQLVVYPVVRLREPVDLIAWIRAIEAGVLSAVRTEWGLPARTIEGRAGVWLTGRGRPDRKICAIGLKVAQAATLHGLALNVSIDPNTAFAGIVPCGLTDADVTSLEREGVSTTVRTAADLLVPHLLEAITPRLAVAPTILHAV